MTLLVSKYNYKPLTRDDSSGRRLYQTPDGTAVPSVTTILDRTKPAEAREALARWKKAVGQQRAQEITTEAAGRGTRMHKFLEDHIKGIPLKESVTNPYAQQSLEMARVVIDQGFVKIDEVWGNEVPLYFPELYAGTTDCVGLHQGQEAILDFKQTNKPKKLEWIDDYFLQPHNETHGTDIKTGVILMCAKPADDDATPQYQEFILEPKDFDMWVERWCDRVSEYYKLS